MKKSEVDHLLLAGILVAGFVTYAVGRKAGALPGGAPVQGAEATPPPFPASVFLVGFVAGVAASAVLAKHQLK